MIPGPALRLYGDGRASPVSNDGLGEANPVNLTERGLSATTSISTSHSSAACHHLSQPHKSPLSNSSRALAAQSLIPGAPAAQPAQTSWRLSAPGGHVDGHRKTSGHVPMQALSESEGADAPDTLPALPSAAAHAASNPRARGPSRRATWSQGSHPTSGTASNAGQLSDTQRLVAFAAVQGAPVSPAGLPHDAWVDADPMDALPLGFANAAQPGQDAPTRRRPFALPSRQQLAQSGLASRASDVPDEASSYTASQRSTRPSVGPAGSASNPIFGGDRSQGRVTVHENMAAWLAAGSAAASPDISPQPSLSVPLLRTSMLLQQHVSENALHSSSAAVSSHVTQHSDAKNPSHDQGMLPFWHESLTQGSAASPSPSLSSPFSMSPFSMSPDLLTRTQPVDVSWDSLAPEVSTLHSFRAAESSPSAAPATAPFDARGNLPEGSAASASSQSRFPQVNAGIPFRGAVRGNFSFSLATQRSIPSITQLSPPPANSPRPSQHAAKPPRDPHSGVMLSNDHPAISRSHRAPLLTAASIESNASGIMLVSNPLAHRSAAGGQDVFLNPLISHRSHLAPTSSQELPHMASQELHSHPLLELPEGSDILLEPSASSSAMSSQHLQSHRLLQPSPLGLTPLNAAVTSSEIPPALLQDSASTLNFNFLAPRDTEDNVNAARDTTDSTPPRQPGAIFRDRRPVAEAAEDMDLEQAMLPCAASSDSSPSFSPAASVSQGFQQALRQQQLHVHSFWRPLRSRAGQQASVGSQQGACGAALVGQLAGRHGGTPQQPANDVSAGRQLLQKFWAQVSPAKQPQAGGSMQESAAPLGGPHELTPVQHAVSSLAGGDLSQPPEPLDRHADDSGRSEPAGHDDAPAPDITIEIPMPGSDSSPAPHIHGMTVPSCTDIMAADAPPSAHRSTDNQQCQAHAAKGNGTCIRRLFRLGEEIPGQTGMSKMQPEIGPDLDQGQPSQMEGDIEALPRDLNSRGSLQLNQSPVRLRHLRGWLAAVGIAQHQPQQPHGNREGPLLQHAQAETADNRENANDLDGDAADAAGPGFYRAPLGLHQFSSWARAATRDPHPFPRPQHLSRAHHPPVDPASSLILRQPRSCCPAGLVNALRSSLAACSSLCCCACQSQPCQLREATNSSPVQQLLVAGRLVIVQAWRHPCGLITGDICWTLLAALVVGAAQGMTPDPSLKRLPADLAVAAIALGLVTAIVSLPLLTTYRLQHVKLPEPAGSIAGCPGYPTRPAMLAAGLSWQVSTQPRCVWHNLVALHLAACYLEHMIFKHQRHILLMACSYFGY